MMYRFQKKVKHFLSNCQKIISKYMSNHMEDAILPGFLLTKKEKMLRKWLQGRKPYAALRRFAGRVQQEITPPMKPKGRDMEI
jgi:hypothetical protein